MLRYPLREFLGDVHRRYMSEAAVRLWRRRLNRQTLAYNRLATLARERRAALKEPDRLEGPE